MTHRVLVARLDGAGDVLLAGPPSGPWPRRRDTEVTLLCGPAGAEAAAAAARGRRRRGLGEPVGGEPRAADRPRPRWTASSTGSPRAASPRPWSSRPSTSRRCPPRCCCGSPASAGSRARRSTTPAPCSTCGCGPATDPGDDLPEDLPEPERALAIAAAAGYRLPAGDPGAARRAARRRRSATCSRHSPAGPTWSLHPGAAVAGAALACRAPPERGGAARRRRPRGRRHRRSGRARPHRGGRGRRPGAPSTSAAAPGSPSCPRVLAGAAAVVVGNTGAAHLAAAVGTPVVSLFAPVVPAVRWRPYRRPARAARRPGRAVPRHPGPGLPRARTSVPRPASSPTTCSPPCGGCAPRPRPAGGPARRARLPLSPTEGTS